MSDKKTLFPVIREDIEFENLFEQAMQAVRTYAGNIWTDTDTHDPGTTLLEAFCYGIMDLAYRQTRPLTDLLTPSPDKQLSGHGLFPAEFGPQQVLTCGPITPDDYCRALLDLHSNGKEDGYFFFNNARLIKEPETERYNYWYVPEHREFHFNNPSEMAGSNKQISLLGNYHLYVMPSRETEMEPQAAELALELFLKNNRNLGEAVSRVIWLKPEDLHLKMEVELDDNIGQNSNVAAILAEIYQVSNAYVTPAILRKSTAELQQQGWTSEEIYHGPWLKHGWIPELPEGMDISSPATVNLSGLVHRLLDIKGIKSIRSLGCPSASSSPWQWVAGASERYPRLWGADPLAALADGVTVKLLAKGDITLVATVESILQEFDTSGLIKNLPQTLPYGRWRNPGLVYPATELVPPCYGLKVVADTPQQTQLHQFLLVFEQLLANSCQQLALLPSLLSFRQQDDVVRGSQWPFSENSVSDKVHHEYRKDLAAELEQYSHDSEHALAITEFLLSYFNSHIAPQIFTQPAKVFLASQQGFLSRQAELVYDRANIRAGVISSLQRRIAARLGLGGANIFDDDMSLEQLPFYMVEHRALLPIQPHLRYSSPQRIRSLVTEMIAETYSLTIWSDDVSELKSGMLIDILLDHGGSDEFKIISLVITHVDLDNKTFSLDISSSVRLRRNLDEILASPADTLAWQNSDILMEEMSYPLQYSDDQSGLTPEQKRFRCSSFPVMLNIDDELLLEYRISAEFNTSDNVELATPLRIISIDRIANTLVVSSDKPFPKDDSVRYYHWYLSPHHKPKDRFSFMVSVVFNQNLLFDSSPDPYATEAWVKEVILAEIPSHLGMLLHWKPQAEFKQFASTYSKWQRNHKVLGDRAYELMSMLSLGQLPRGLEGIGAMYVATPEKRDLVVGQDGSSWNSDVIIEEQLFYVPANEQPDELKE
ncbi:TPA: hypothetical protein SIA35_004274 [Aeromonas sobria]|nr:hypothetical protein [Aeromonas sobria]